MLSIKNLFGFRKNKGLDKSIIQKNPYKNDTDLNKRIIQKNPYRNNIDLNKRQFIKKGLFGLAGLGGLALASKVAKAGGLVFNDGSTQSAGSLEGTSIKSTSETGGTKFLREDGDGTSSWQTGGPADALIGSGAGNELKTIQIGINGKTSDEISCYITYSQGDNFNAQGTISGTTSANFGKSGSATVSSGNPDEVTYSLNSNGSGLTVDVTDNPSNILNCCVMYNRTGSWIQPVPTVVSGNLYFDCKTFGMAQVDLATVTGSDETIIHIRVTYICGGSM